MTALFEDHLSLDAVVAFADGEMSMLAYQRAAAHLARCPSCAAEVGEQAAARQYLRSAPPVPAMPGSLFESLRAIPLACPEPPAAYHDHSHGARGPRGFSYSRLFRIGAGAVVAGVALGALVSAADAGEAAPTVQGPAVTTVSVSNNAPWVQPIGLRSGR